MDRNHIKTCINQLIQDLAIELETCPEEVADIAFLHIQKHPSWGRNATVRQRHTSYKKWNGVCQGCQKEVDFVHAVFHHLKRRIPNQHDPENLLPYHNECHDHKHGVTKGSLTKGTRTSEV